MGFWADEAIAREADLFTLSHTSSDVLAYNAVEITWRINTVNNSSHLSR